MTIIAIPERNTSIPSVPLGDTQKLWVPILRNPFSGSGGRDRQIPRLLNQLRTHQLEPKLFTDRDELGHWLQGRQEAELIAGIVACGGDGTVAETVNRYPGIPVAVLPMGTENLFAKHLKLPWTGKGIADLISRGQTCELDLGVCGERRFTVMASVGIDAEVIHRFHAVRTGRISKLDYVLPTFRSLFKYEFPTIRVYADGESRPREGKLLIAGNMPRYALGLRIAETATADDGLLHIRLMKQGSLGSTFAYFRDAYLGRLNRRSDVESFTAKSIRVESDAPVPIQIDGDPAGTTPTTVTLEPKALRAFANEGFLSQLAKTGC